MEIIHQFPIHHTAGLATSGIGCITSGPMERIVESLLAEFVTEYSFADQKPDKQFEHFCAHIAIRTHYKKSFATEEVVTGRGGDTTIDAVAIIVNGVLITEIGALEAQDELGTLDVAFVFVQAETGGGFDAKKMRHFGLSVEDFFSETPLLLRNDSIKKFAKIAQAVFDRGNKFKSNPSCHLYYVTTGKWNADNDPESMRRDSIISLTGTEWFSAVSYTPIGKREIQELYRYSKNSIPKEFQFDKKVTIPSIPGVKQSYVGFLPAETFIEIVKDNQGGINARIFDDNVRDWLQTAKVNAEIKETLNSEASARFILMNNGVTIIARTLTNTGDDFRMENFSIVNGCQTSHVLFESRASLHPSVLIPIRLIATDDEAIINDIIKATNRQTQLKPEQFYALFDFSKDLERFFVSFPGEKRLYYERRSGQYDRENIEKTRVIGAENVIRAFAAMFREKPHWTTRNFGKLKDEVGETIFVKDQKMDPYYTAAFALYKLDRMFKNGRVSPRLRPAKFHILMALRFIACGIDRPPRENSNDMEKFCAAILAKLWDSTTAEKLLISAATVVERSLSIQFSDGEWDRDDVRTEPFTATVLTQATLEML